MLSSFILLVEIIAEKKIVVSNFIISKVVLKKMFLHNASNFSKE